MRGSRNSENWKPTMDHRLLKIVVLLMAPLFPAAAVSQAQDVITLNPAITHQTITGWEAAKEAGQSMPSFSTLKNIYPALFDQAVNDLGINRLRVEIRSGVENAQDYWSQFMSGQINYTTWRCVRYSTVNDNNDPFVINGAGYQFSELDHHFDNVVLPIKQRVEARGEKLHINVEYVAAIGQICAPYTYHHGSNAEEYAEFVLATYQHLQNKYGFVPDTWEVVLEPDGGNTYFGGTYIGQVIVAAANRLKANGFTPKFVAPSTVDVGNASPYFDAMIQVPGALQYLSELSYHRYGGATIPNLQAIASRAVKYGIKTSQLEHIGADYRELHDDIKIGRTSAWQQFTLACSVSACGNTDNGGKYYLIDDSNPTNPQIIIGSRTKFLRQYFKFIRSGAVRIEAATNNSNFDPVAFINTNGKYVVVVKASVGGSFSIQGLPAGTYGIKFTTATQYDLNLTDVTIGAGQSVNANIPSAGVITIYAKAASPQTDTTPPAPNRFRSTVN